LKIREIVKLVEQDGWFQVSQTGSHRQFKHPRKRGRVTIAGKPNADLKPKTLKSILNQAQIEV
jgi:predicted RNA binding protein YcfA (HicA-like mRNA interferase family)